jgi:hypothetical protein
MWKLKNKVNAKRHFILSIYWIYDPVEGLITKFCEHSYGNKLGKIVEQLMDC